MRIFMTILKIIAVVAMFCVVCAAIMGGAFAFIETLFPEPSDQELKEAVTLLIVDYTKRHTEKTHYRPELLSETTTLSTGLEITMEREQYMMEEPDSTWVPVTYANIVEREKREKLASKARMAKLLQLASEW